MKNIAVYFEKPGLFDYPFDDEDFRQNYQDIAQAIIDKGGRFFVVRGKSPIGGSRFSSGWEYRDGNFDEVRGEIHADVVWNKDYFEDEDAIIINAPALDTLLTDKWTMYQMFPHLHARSSLVSDMQEWESAIAALRTAVVLAKPLAQFGGTGILIGNKRAVTLARPPVLPCIVQEFIDTGGGIPSLVEGPHDFRIICIAGTVVASYIRTPPEGSLLSNISQGGMEITVPLEKIPEPALKIFREVDAALEHFPSRIYSVDMACDRKGKWRIIELNAKPGAPKPGPDPSYGMYVEALADLLIRATS